MPRNKGQTFVDKDILIVLEEHKGYGLRFGDIFHALSAHDMFHYQQQISKNLTKLIEEGKVVKVKGRPRYFYGIPNQRTNGSKYLIVRGTIEDEEIDVE
jgi:hypothetical protein